ncbi:hypothetical protein ACFPVX_01210 [Cohnella faecalis]|uniref:Uncharacterized protein n=1 Tax=Cohnella faecalis TaxID=2315694 RepID=A0A398D0F1_9BACL|nr:hypothetical protein [Cohnella faecalis]RIE04644.1 hypothetical protein D3H35_03905 [Cohnella faecalis]
MAHWLRFGGLLATGFAVVLLLGRLPAIERSPPSHRQSLEVFTPVQVKTLTGENLVDAMIGLPLRERLSRVGWDHSILTVDLSVEQPLAAPRDVWRDTARLIRFSFFDVQGVRQLLVRVYSVDGGQRTLLFSAETRPGDWTEERLASLRTPIGYPDDEFRAGIHLVIYPQGELWLRNFAN